MRSLHLTFFISLLLASCQPQSKQQVPKEHSSQKESITSTTVDNQAVNIVEQQLKAYNAHDIEAFVATYADSVEIYSPDGELLMKGHTQLINGYQEFFANTPALHCKILNRMTINNTVIDKEEVIINDTTTIYGVAIYKIKDSKIQSVNFVD